MTRNSAILLAVLAFLLGGIVVLAPRIVDPDQYRPYIVRTLEVILGYPVSIDAVELAPAGGLRLELKSLEVKSFDPADPPLLRVGQIYVGLDWSFLFTSKIKVTSVMLVNPQINLVQRSDRPLLNRARDGARWSNANMSRTLGLALTDLTLGRVVIRDGTLRLKNQEQPDERNWVMDHIQIQIHNLTPQRASAISGSALVQSIPFTAHGQIGPLPMSLNPLEMPLLLSVEGKSSRPDHLTAILNKLHLNARAERGYFSTLVHGKLLHGMQTNSWLELHRLEFFPANRKTPSPSARKNLLVALLNERPDQIRKDILASPPPKDPAATARKEAPLAGQNHTPLTTRKETPPVSMDVAIRQKSILKMEDLIPQATFQEFYLFLNDSPLLDLKGTVRYEDHFVLDLEGTTMNSLALEGIPWSVGSLSAGGSLEGSMHIQGVWPAAFVLTGKLNLTQTDLLWRDSIHKPVGTPLKIALSLNHQDAVTSSLETVIQGEENELLTMRGELHPQPDLSLVGTWDMHNLLPVLHDIKEWSGDGLVAMNLHLTRPAEIGWQIQGTLQGGKSRLGPLVMESFSTPVQISRMTWEFSDLRLRVANGNLDGAIQILHSDPFPVFHARLGISGVAFERFLNVSPPSDSLLNRLAETKAAAPIRLEGLLFGQGDFWGQLDKRLLPEGTWSGQANLRLEPGRLVGLDGAVFTNNLVDGQNLFQEGKSFYWKMASATLNFFDGRIRFDNVRLASDGLTLQGKGTRDAQGNQSLDIAVTSEWLNNNQSVTGTIISDGQKLFFRRQPSPGG
ncbi:MAG: hypothetical protein H7833_01975 [Magnetococcus sp. DMHC-1]|nr:hypothetical protein [Magnetococcales bacterium]